MQVTSTPIAPPPTVTAPSRIEPKSDELGTGFEQARQQGFDPAMQNRRPPQGADQAVEASAKMAARQPETVAPNGPLGRRINLSV